MVDQGIRGRSGGGSPASRNNGGTALANGFTEGAFEPSGIIDHTDRGLAIDFGMTKCGEHRRTVITEDKNVAHIRSRNSGFFGQHRLSAVLI